MKKLALILLIILFSAGGYFIISQKTRVLTEKEKQAALVKLTGENPGITNSNISKGDKEYKGKYLSFMYPATAAIYNLTVNGKKVEDTAALEYFAFDTKAPNISVVTEVIESPPSVLKAEDYPSVRLRQTDLSYSQSQITISNITGLSFTKNNPGEVEKSAFFYSDGKMYTFSVTGSDFNSVSGLFNKITSTAKFLN